MYKRNIFRWTIGGTNRNGYECLKHSINTIFRIYGELFEYYILYNNSNIQIIREIVGHKPITIISQTWKHCPLPIDLNTNKGTSLWKFCPPRLDVDSHEIIVDNDIVIIKKINKIDEFLSKEDSVILVEDPIKYQGKFRHLFKNNEQYNAGFLGLPPKYDLGLKIRETWLQNGSPEIIGQADEQGLATATLKNEKFILIPKEDFLLVHSNGGTASSRHIYDVNKNEIFYYPVDFFQDGASAYHFVGLNKNQHNHWESFNKKINQRLFL